MKIRIVKACYPTVWYANKIGEVFDATDCGTQYLLDKSLSAVYKEDCEEVIEHNSQLYRKVDRPVREGDTVLITEFDGNLINEVRIVDRLYYFNGRNDGSLWIDEKIYDEDFLDTHSDKYVIIELIEQPVQPSAPSYVEVSELLYEAKGEPKEESDLIIHNGKQYCKVKRKAVASELVIGIDQEDYIASVDGYIVGNVYMVTRLTEESDGTIKYNVDDMFSDGTPLFLYESEFNVLELVEQSSQDELLTVNDLLANLAQEVAELKRELHRIESTVLDHVIDIADLEDRVDENEKDVEEVIGRINDLGDGAEVTAFVPVEVIKKVVSELVSMENEMFQKRNENEGRYQRAAITYHGEAIGIGLAIDKINKALRND